MKRLVSVVVVAVALSACGASPLHHVSSHAEKVATSSSGCGRERWDVKTGTDATAAQVNLAPVDATVAALDALPTSNPGSPDQTRDADAESTVYRVTATLDAVKQEADGDFHLALSDDQGNTMIAEIPNAPACTTPPYTPQPSAWESTLEQVRAQFVQLVGEPSSQSWLTPNERVTITGVGFFDVPHGQRNVAPNAVELHPVLSIAVP